MVITLYEIGKILESKSSKKNKKINIRFNEYKTRICKLKINEEIKK